MTRVHRRRPKTKCSRGRVGLCPARPAPENFCRVREREALTRRRYSSSPLDYSLLPNKNSIAQFEEQSHDGGEEGRHDDEGGEDFAVFGQPCAQLTYQPRPDLTPTVSATTRVRKDAPSPMNRPMKI